MHICQSLIGGKPVKSNLPVIEKRYPATGEVIAQIEPASSEMLDHAVAVAQEAQISWAKTDAPARSVAVYVSQRAEAEARRDLTTPGAPEKQWKTAASTMPERSEPTSRPGGP